MTDYDYNELCRMRNALDAAIASEDERRFLKEDRDHWRNLYQELLSQSLKEAQETTGMLIEAVFSGLTLGGNKL